MNLEKIAEIVVDSAMKVHSALGAGLLENAYQACVSWLFERFPSYQNIGAEAYKPGLERVFELLDILQIDPKKVSLVKKKYGI